MNLDVSQIAVLAGIGVVALLVGGIFLLKTLSVGKPKPLQEPAPDFGNL